MMNFSSMETKSKNEYNNKAKCVLEYTHDEECNSNFRPKMEDDHFALDYFMEEEEFGLFGILDGHGGADVPKFCAKSIPETFEKFYWDFEKNIEKLFQVVFSKVDDQLKMVGANDSGSTACVCFVKKENKKTYIHLANLGDTRAVLLSKDGAERVTVDHKATDPSEIKRIQDAGGFVAKSRVSGQLAVTRALGDLALKKEGVINVPYYRKVEVTSSTQYLIMASDGLWDVVEDKDLHTIIKDAKKFDEIGKVLISHALKNGSKDNISVLILKFN